MNVSANAEKSLAEEIAEYQHDPLGFVLFAYPWGTGELAGRTGPHPWQAEALQEIGEALRNGLATGLFEAIQLARASGHGIGKSTLVAWLIEWAMSTMEDTRGVVTANTENQLKTKTWAELSKWHRMCITREWFKMTATALMAADPAHEKTWRIDMVPWSESNTEAFAGLHNAGKRVLVIYDEGSAIPDAIYEVTEGALTDEHTEIIWAVFGNPTRNQGRFFECFNKFRKRWRTAQIDSRDVPGTNKQQIANWAADYGEDSDFFRVRVRGVFPSAAAMQFIAEDVIDGAFTREMKYTRPHVAIVGVDVGRFGDDPSVIRTRIGRDSRMFEPIRMYQANTNTICSALVDHLAILRSHKLQIYVFVDGTGGYGGNVVDRMRELGFNVTEVLFSQKADNPKKYFNKRTEMYARMREWLKVGYLNPDEELKRELMAIMYQFRGEALQLWPKELIKDLIGRSPDDSDALALTFAYPVDELPDNDELRKRRGVVTPAAARREYNPFSTKH